MSLLTLTVEKNVVDEMSHAHARPGVSARRMLGVCIAVSVSATGPAHALTANIANCTVPYLQSFAPSNTHLTSAAIINATSTLPMYCRVDGTIDTPNSTALTFSTGLPTVWNEKFVMLTQGGFAGNPPNPAGGSGTGGSPAPLAAGYATGSTDTGHRGGSFDGSFSINHPDLIIDFGHRGNKVTVDASKALIAGYYQSAIKRSLLVGCSNGGRSTMIHAQRYPDDFDGYVVGAPAYAWPGMLGLDFHHSNLAWFSKAGSWLSPAKVKLLSDAVLAACDANDGLADAVIDDPRKCSFDVRTLQCRGADSDSCLTLPQIAAVQLYSSDLKNSYGDTVSPHWLLNGDEVAGLTAWKLGANPPPIAANGRPEPLVPTIASPNTAQAFSFFFEYGSVGWQGFNDPNWYWRNFNLDKDLNYLAQVDGMTSALSTNLMPTVSHGAKFIFYHGWADQALNPLRTIMYYDDVVERFGKQHTDSFMRVFMVPGMQHCTGGTVATDRADYIGALEQWLDTGVAPTRIDAPHVQGGVTTRTRPLCAYPLVARFTGPQGASTNDAANFSCVADQ